MAELQIILEGTPGLGPGRVYVAQSLGDGWHAIYHLGPEGITHIDIQRSDRPVEHVWRRGHGRGAGELTARALRQLQPGLALSAGRRAMRGSVPEEAAWLDIPSIEPSTPRLRTNATVAAHYVEAIGGGSRTPIADVATKLGLDPEQVRDRVHAAREDGLLTRSSGRGRAGGSLTDAARSLLQEDQK